jgi:hypothetical protein
MSGASRRNCSVAGCSVTAGPATPSAGKLVADKCIATSSRFPIVAKASECRLSPVAREQKPSRMNTAVVTSIVAKGVTGSAMGRVYVQENEHSG